MKIILITRDRPELTEQTFETMEGNAANWDKHELIIVRDEECPESGAYAHYYTGRQLGVGGAKNYGVSIFEKQGKLGPDDILMFSDNDMYYLPNWDKRLEEGLLGTTQLGGWKHPFHGINRVVYKDRGVCEVDAVTGNCFVLRYSDWLKYGPFDSNALGPGQSEDYALSQKIKAGGGLVATLDPPVAIHCGLANCEGKAATGWEQMAAMVETQLQENNIEKIWLEVPDEGAILLERKLPGNPKESTRSNNFRALNIGSGQRRFGMEYGWINVDCVSRPPDQVPDVICDATKLTEKFPENSQDMVVLHHVIEHFGCGEADEVLKQCFKVLRPGGRLLVFVPDLRKLAGRWLSGEIDTFTFLVNTYGAYQGEEGDRHKWGFDAQHLYETLKKVPGTGQIRLFDWREIPGADIAKDWWILGMEIVKD